MRRTLAAGLIVFGLGVGVARVAREPLAGPISGADLHRRVGTRPTRRRTRRSSRTPSPGATRSSRPSSRGASSRAARQRSAWATSGDGGTRWRSGTVPLGDYAAASDPVVAFDAAHHVWLIAGIGFRGRFHEVFVSRSTDGSQVGRSRCVAADSSDEDHDKEWIGCDNCDAIAVPRALLPRLRRHDPLAARHPHERRRRPDVVEAAAAPARSDGAGRGVLRPDAGHSSERRPRRTVLVLCSVEPGRPRRRPGRSRRGRRLARRRRDLLAAGPDLVRSSPPTTSPRCARPSLPSATVDAAGKMYVAWQDGRFRSSGDANDIVFSTSTNGSQWSEPVRVPLSFGPSYILPAIAVGSCDVREEGANRDRVLLDAHESGLQGLRARLLPADRLRGSCSRRTAAARGASPRKLNAPADADRVARRHDARRDARRLHQRLVREGEGGAGASRSPARPPRSVTASRSSAAGSTEPAPRTPAAISSQCRRPSP